LSVFGYKKKIKQFAIFGAHQKKINKFKQETRAQTIEAAKNDAIYNPPPKDTNLETLPEVNKIKAGCSKTLAEVNKTAMGILDTPLTKFQQADEKIQNKERITAKFNILNNEKNEAKEVLIADFNKKDKDFETSLTAAKDDLRNHQLDLQSKTKHYLFWSCFFTVFLMAGAAGTEVSYTAKAFEITGLTFYEKYLVAVGLGICTIFIGVGTIEILISKMIKHWKAINSFSFFLLICGVYFALGKLRVRLVKNEMSSGVSFESLSAFDFMLINLVFYVAIILIHWLIWPSKSKFQENNEYNKKRNQQKRKRN